MSGICTVHMHACSSWCVRSHVRACFALHLVVLFSEIITGLSIVSLNIFVLFSQREPRGRAVQPVGNRRPCIMCHRLASSPLPCIHQHQQRARWAFQPPAIGTSRDGACTMPAADSAHYLAGGLGNDGARGRSNAPRVNVHF